jgi:hypothetical protein
VALHFDEAAEGERVFNSLAPDDAVQMLFQSTFWAKGFGMLVIGSVYRGSSTPGRRSRAEVFFGE